MTSTPVEKNSVRTFQSRDLLAGLAIAGLLLPEAVAYASLANLPPQAAVVALFAGLICYALVGVSRFAIVSATSSSAAVLAAASASMANGNADLRYLICSALVIATGAFFLMASIARLGAVTDFIAKPVLRGFAFGLALVIVAKQLPKMMGISTVSGDFFHLLVEILKQLPNWNWITLIIGVTALGVMSLCSRVKYLPGALVVIVLSVILSDFFSLQEHGVALVGDISIRFSMPGVPHIGRVEWLRVGELALALAMILYAESYGSIRNFALKHGDPTSPNRDLAALGMANLVSGLFQGMPVGAGYSASSANEAAGAGSRLAGLAAAVVLFIVVMTLLPAVARTPEVVLAAIVIHAVSHTLNPKPLLTYFRWHRDRIVVCASVLAVLLLGVLDGLLLAIGVSMLMTLSRFSESRVSILGRFGDSHDFVSIQLHQEAAPIQGLLIVRPEEPLFFANVDRILNQIRALVSRAGDSVHTVVLSLEESPDLDSSSAEALRDFCVFVGGLQKQILFARVKDSAQALLLRTDIPALCAPATWGSSVDQAVQYSRRPAATA
ncbi:MAG TPA: SulP family inorganic anion transporter [Burkholderiaceae bacterium]